MTAAQDTRTFELTDTEPLAQQKLRELRRFCVAEEQRLHALLGSAVSESWRRVLRVELAATRDVLRRTL